MKRLAHSGATNTTGKERRWEWRRREYADGQRRQQMRRLERGLLPGRRRPFWGPDPEAGMPAGPVDPLRTRPPAWTLERYGSSTSTYPRAPFPFPYSPSSNSP